MFKFVLYQHLSRSIPQMIKTIARKGKKALIQYCMWPSLTRFHINLVGLESSQTTTDCKQHQIAVSTGTNFLPLTSPGLNWCDRNLFLQYRMKTPIPSCPYGYQIHEYKLWDQVASCILAKAFCSSSWSLSRTKNYFRDTTIDLEL